MAHLVAGQALTGVVEVLGRGRQVPGVGRVDPRLAELHVVVEQAPAHRLHVVTRVVVVVATQSADLVTRTRERNKFSTVLGKRVPISIKVLFYDM